MSSDHLDEPQAARHFRRPRQLPPLIEIPSNPLIAEHPGDSAIVVSLSPRQLSSMHSQNQKPATPKDNADAAQSRKEEQPHSLRCFAIMLIIIQTLLIVLTWIFARIQMNIPSQLASQRYPAFQDINVMILLGFGYLMTFIRSYGWSSILYTLLVNSLLTQIYILLSSYWHRVLASTFQTQFHVDIDIPMLINCSYAVSSALIALNVCIGRLRPQDILILGLMHVLGYILNEGIVLKSIKMIDGGGSSFIHTFGAYYGVMACIVLSRKKKPNKNIKTSYNSNLFAFLGTLFLWLYWPSFNYARIAQNQYEQTMIVVNTVLAMTSSTLGTFFINSVAFGTSFHVQDFLNSTLAGGVVIGAASSILYRPGLSLLIGFTTGILSAVCLHKLTPKLLKWFGLYDTCGIHNLHGIPGILGGIWSAIIVAFYNSGYDQAVAQKYSSGHLLNIQKSFLSQGGIQIAGTFISLAMGLIFGFIGGMLTAVFYKVNAKNFYLDTVNFESVSKAVILEGRSTTSNVYLVQDHPMQENGQQSQVNLREQMYRYSGEDRDFPQFPQDVVKPPEAIQGIIAPVEFDTVKSSPANAPRLGPMQINLITTPKAQAQNSTKSGQF